MTAKHALPKIQGYKDCQGFQYCLATATANLNAEDLCVMWRDGIREILQNRSIFSQQDSPPIPRERHPRMA